MIRIRLTLDIGRPVAQDPSLPPEASAEGAESCVEVAGAPERRQLGFAPPSDPIRRTDPEDFE